MQRKKDIFREIWRDIELDGMREKAQEIQRKRDREKEVFVY